ncbi:MAG: hypothetical protein KDG44_08670 [Burkholderiaceae bacterium]|nr:hypothetical protein [Burkholderiaceae bacterium]
MTPRPYLSDIENARVAGELRGKRASIALWLGVCLALSLSGWNLFNAALAAAAKCGL